MTAPHEPDTDAPSTPDDSGRPRRLLLVLPLVIMAVVGVGAFVTQDLWRWYFVDDDVVDEVPQAPTLEADSPDQIVFRIDAGRSSVSYEITERLVGTERTAVGTTSGVAGDIVVDTADPTRSHAGDIVVNVEMLRSDNSLRDKRIRHDYLESSHHRFATFTPTTITGLPSAVTEGEVVPLTVTGDLTVKDITAPATFEGTATWRGDTLTIEMSGTVLLSTYDAGPIGIAGLVHTDDEVLLRLELVAVDTRRADLPGADALDVAPPADEIVEVAAGSGEVSFAHDVLPILEANCASCHNSGGAGASTWTLDTAADAAVVADGLGVVVGGGYMPPWPASDLSVPFRDVWRLDPDEVDTVVAWARAGGPLDVPADTPVTATGDQLITIDPDVVVSGDPYAGDPAVSDDYRCQINAIPIDEPTFITGFEFRPDRLDVVHHAIVFLARASTIDRARALDDADEGPGWTCYGLSGIRGDVTQILGWAPGQQPTTYPDGYGIPVFPGDFLVTQIHYHYDHEAPLDHSEMALEFADPDELAAGMQRLGGAVLLAPAELPCSTDQTGPLCDRAASKAKVRDQFGAFGAGIEDFLLQRCGMSVEDFAGFTDGVSHSSCDYPLTQPATLIGVLGHMHEYGSAFRMTLNPDTPDETVLLDIPVWSFEWQFTYRLADPIEIGPGDTVRIECTWDRSVNPNNEPRYVLWAEGTGDEMCYSTMTWIPH
ncbi:MAG: hypothetical protein D6683_11470 [Actinomyces sp.]|nr:MAG: hypothetical protein D6683_11470 [Actinomyces sp.]